MGRPVSWLAMATLNCVNSAWKALLKCAECVGRREPRFAVHHEPGGP